MGGEEINISVDKNEEEEAKNENDKSEIEDCKESMNIENKNDDKEDGNSNEKETLNEDLEDTNEENEVLENNDITEEDGPVNADEEEVEKEQDEDTEGIDMSENEEQNCEEDNKEESNKTQDDKEIVAEPDKALLRTHFSLFSKFGDKSSDGSTIKLSQSDKWFKQAGLIRPKGISSTDTSIAFRKISKKAPKLNFMDWCKFLEEVAKTKKMNVNIIKVKLLDCSKPGNTGTKIAKSAALNRLTDPSNS